MGQISYTTAKARGYKVRRGQVERPPTIAELERLQKVALQQGNASLCAHYQGLIITRRLRRLYKSTAPFYNQLIKAHSLEINSKGFRIPCDPLDMVANYKPEPVDYSYVRWPARDDLPAVDGEDC